VLRALEASPRSGALLTAAFEWAAECALAERAASTPTSNVAQYLGAHLGCVHAHVLCALRAAAARASASWRQRPARTRTRIPHAALTTHANIAGRDALALAPPWRLLPRHTRVIVRREFLAPLPPPRLDPASLLWSLLDGLEGDAAAAVCLASVRLLRRRVAWRSRAARELRVCVTWRGAPTSLSTANTRGARVELPAALAASDAAFVAALAAATGEGARAAAECAAAQRDDAGATPTSGDDLLP
jgi:hypothetical protein